MTAPEYNQRRLIGLERQLEAGTAAVRGMLDLIDASRDPLSRQRTEALSFSPIPWPASGSMPELAAKLETELERVTADPKAHPRNASQCRTALALVYSVIDGQARMAALRAEVDQKHAELAPLRAVVRACQAHIGRDDFVILGVAR